MGGTDAERTTIIGVSENVRYFGPVGDVKPEIMLPIGQAKGWTFEVLRGGEFVVHAAPEALDSIMPAIRARLTEVAPSVPLHSVSGMDEEVRNSSAHERFLAQLTSGFGVLALAIAAVGVLGVVLFGVNSGRRELGVRMALGQTPVSIAWHVLARGVRVGISAAVAGILLTYASSRIVAAAVHGPGRPEPMFVALSSVTLLAAVMLACLLPAIKAIRLDPRKVLGAE